jgi:hypothetical protein
MRPTTRMARLTLIPQEANLTIAARGPLALADVDHLAAVCVSLPPETGALTIDLTGAGLLGANLLRRLARVASSWRYARSAPVTLRFRAIRHDDDGEPLADEVPVEVRYPVRAAAARRWPAILLASTRGRGVFVVAPPRLALRNSA